jgi:hypothetical protein
MPVREVQAVFHGVHPDELSDCSIAIEDRQRAILVEHADVGPWIQPPAAYALDYMRQAARRERIEPYRVAQGRLDTHVCDELRICLRHTGAAQEPADPLPQPTYLNALHGHGSMPPWCAALALPSPRQAEHLTCRPIAQAATGHIVCRDTMR